MLSLCFRFRSRREMLRVLNGLGWVTLQRLGVAVRTMAGVPTVSLPELRSLLASGQARLIDVRTREEAAAGTIPSALNIPGVLPDPISEPESATPTLLTPPPVSELESALQMEPAAFQALYAAEKPRLEEENLIFFCQIGKRGFLATQLAQGLGYAGARNYAGAYREWLQKEG
ncbi:PREDICTED: thiosulfate sulfurtransferase/rhodanese-like domain-containing protein 1 isoform X1 [Condylura cristata]|uniref:thiosulfate sulfurtransferase/rhodanese-like domain-containing protein 1 isoform X1 n=1 Tax=Condylura cristata TaxID=143302 RepID=UPI000642C4F3|nr:PREDICTED: thiosulfate sulfurtransferase/rhodanese-like domain-containing protein 1 isoform X1 [Condylura cristata]